MKDENIIRGKNERSKTGMNGVDRAKRPQRG
jgi:hypothetical protein